MEMTMILLLLPTIVAAATWLLNIASFIVARALNMPQPLVLSAGIVVFAHVQAVETSLGRSLCPRRLARQLRALWRAIR
jgi:hypothetical protein